CSCSCNTFGIQAIWNQCGTSCDEGLPPKHIRSAPQSRIYYLKLMNPEEHFNGGTAKTQEEVTISGNYRLGLGRRPRRRGQIGPAGARALEETLGIFVSEAGIATRHVPTGNPRISLLDCGRGAQAWR